ncbi:uncharacterized protein CXQ87_004675 [Candidozyma duobushaemuli]|uniref:candidapepsin n=2 Tax=Candidozyma TaxID=3303203 RepID=A0ABX8IBM2_9ASCO|nr:uncharacterized protein CXQ87_004675 [[Candida] duobushaemulonis]PVH17114.1 hypothetical protein CXQ87_004675 [[Candida] duobushaemulonis]QWU89874.1 hypothetical protein CA3LBN_004222 [[Candida] haemuloni]
MLSFLSSLAVLVYVNALTIPHGEYHGKRSVSPLKIDFTVSKQQDETIEQLNAKASALAAHYAPDTLQKRAIDTPIVNYRDVSYLMDFQLGDNQQQISAILDTGSSDLWVNGPEIDKPEGGTYDHSQSSSSKMLDEEFFISYLDKSYAGGEYYTDQLAINGEKVLDDFQFAVVNKSENNSRGVFGIADKNQLVTNNTYDNLPWALKKAGVTPKASYSLFLGSREAKKGSIVFGGIDTEKYEGELTKYPVEGSRGLALNLKSAEVAGETHDLDIEILLDSGTSLNLWPQEIVDAIAKQLDGKPIQGLYLVECEQPSDKYVSFDFGQNKIKISYQDLVWSSEGLCLLGVRPSSNNTHIFGDVFLRSAYVYYDLSEHEISIAQAKYTNSSNIIEA